MLAFSDEGGGGGWICWKNGGSARDLPVSQIIRFDGMYEMEMMNDWWKNEKQSSLGESRREAAKMIKKNLSKRYKEDQQA